MAYRRAISIRAHITARPCHPSVCHIFYDDDRKHQQVDDHFSSQNWNNFLQRRHFSNSFSKSNTGGFGSFYEDGRFSNALLRPSSGFAFCRYMSTAIGESSDKIELMTDVAEVLSDTTVQAVASQVPAVNEVAIAAADSYLPVQLLQYFIDAVHTYTGLNW